ncbi:MAG: GAK system ATP-grasp enzyme [Deltaproteobacteria bacterium]|nr:GAK system ATP-grasp enzyme [Deltaproteobacteria bacterium]
MNTTGPRMAVVGTIGGWSSELLADTVGRLTGQRLLVDMEEVRADLDSGQVWYRGVDLATMDGLMIKKIGARYSPLLLDRLEILRYLESRGTRVFSSPEAIIRVLNRLTCTVTMRMAGIPMPPTTITESVDEAIEAVGMYNQAVFKPLYTSKGRGMCVIADNGQCAEKIRDYHRDNAIMYIQQMIDLNGRDLGIVFLGGKYVTTYARCSTDGSAWNTTTVSGGKYEACDPLPESIEVAERAQALFGLEFTCVDVVETSRGPMVFEVSAFGGFRGILEARGLDAAELYAKHVLGRLGA